jgi:glycosyltransferase involved in cell wall biosynthesis
MRHADVVFTDNSVVKAELVAHGIPSERIHVQRPVVNVDQVRSADVCHRYQVMFIGRMVRSKGIYDLVDALKEVAVSAGLVGDGEELAALREYVKKCGLEERVHILGALPSPEMYALLKGCELFVFPSNEEGYGIAIAEAIAADKPVLAYDLPHYREVFNDSLMTVPVGNVKMLAGRLHDFFAGKIDIEAIREKYRDVSLVSKEDAAAFELGIIRAAIEKGSHERKE